MAMKLKFWSWTVVAGLLLLTGCPEPTRPDLSTDFAPQMKLLDDADLDVDEMLDEYCRLFYGPAAGPMKQFFSLLEERYCDPDNWKLAPGQTSVDWDVICPPSVLARFGSFIEQATALAAEDPYRTRVRLMNEAIYGVMRQNCLRHAGLAESGVTKLSVPFLDDPGDGLTRAEGKHVESFVTMGGNPTGTNWSFLSHTFLKVLSVPAEKYWMLDFVVPLTHLTGGEPVKSGAVWGFNICRNRLGGPDRYTAWCPTVRGFHVPNAFGSLTFQ